MPGRLMLDRWVSSLVGLFQGPDGAAGRSSSEHDGGPDTAVVGSIRLHLTVWAQPL